MMIGILFNLISEIYNYNRRSVVIIAIFRWVFFDTFFNFYNDKYEFEPEEIAIIRLVGRDLLTIKKSF